MSPSFLAILCLLSWPGGFHPAVGVGRDVSIDHTPAAVECLFEIRPPAARDQRTLDSPRLWNLDSLLSGEDSSDSERSCGNLASLATIDCRPSLSAALGFAAPHLGASPRPGRSPILRC